MTSHATDDADTASVHDSTQPDPVTVQLPDLLEEAFGPLQDLTMSMADDSVSWAGTDDHGTPVSGKLRPDFYLGDDRKSIVLSWEIARDEGSTK
jgi:hypothetical protein